MRRRLVLAALSLSLPVSLAAFAYGCSPQAPAVQDFCGFLGNPDNCYLKFFEDVGARCGVAGKPEVAPVGAFLARDKLDKCVLKDGGLITFDMAANVEAFPPTALSFTRTDAMGNTCGSFRFAGPFDFSVTVQPSLTPEGPSVKDAGPDCQGDDGGMNDAICGGTFTSVNVDGDFVDTTCPNGEAHHFISLQLDRPECAKQKELVLRYEIDAVAGGIDVPGYLKLRAFYPTGETVQFFDCAIPPAPKQCCNGIQDGSETGIDCGGPKEPASTACPRCQAGQGCISTADCESETNGICMVEPTTGLKTCVGGKPSNPGFCNPPDAGAGDGGADDSDAGDSDAGDSDAGDSGADASGM